MGGRVRHRREAQFPTGLDEADVGKRRKLNCARLLRSPGAEEAAARVSGTSQKRAGATVQNGW